MLLADFSNSLANFLQRSGSRARNSQNFSIRNARKLCYRHRQELMPYCLLSTNANLQTYSRTVGAGDFDARNTQLLLECLDASHQFVILLNPLNAKSNNLAHALPRNAVVFAYGVVGFAFASLAKNVHVAGLVFWRSVWGIFHGLYTCMSRLARQVSYAYWAEGGGLTVNIKLEGIAEMQAALRAMSNQVRFTAGRAI